VQILTKKCYTPVLRNSNNMTNWYDPTPEDLEKIKIKQMWLQKLRDKQNIKPDTHEHNN